MKITETILKLYLSTLGALHKKEQELAAPVLGNSLKSTTLPVEVVTQNSIKTMNKTILELIDQMPKDGTHPYFWTAGNYHGSTEDVYHNSMKIMTADVRGTYCCGITFELFLKSLAKHDIIYPYSEIMEMQRAFFITQPLKDRPLYENKGMAGLRQGKEIKETDALAGDFCQLWRVNGSGHSVIFIEHIKRADNIIGMKYFSTQKKSNGVGYNEEYYNNVANPIHRAYFWRYGNLEAV